MIKKICLICYENVNKCDNCNIDLKKRGWCSEDGLHYCNEDCQPTITETTFEEEVK